jgi:hypothetical protein
VCRRAARCMRVRESESPPMLLPTRRRQGATRLRGAEGWRAGDARGFTRGASREGLHARGFTRGASPGSDACHQLPLAPKARWCLRFRWERGGTPTPKGLLHGRASTPVQGPALPCLSDQCSCLTPSPRRTTSPRTLRPCAARAPCASAASRGRGTSCASSGPRWPPAPAVGSTGPSTRPGRPRASVAPPSDPWPWYKLPTAG